MPARGTREVRWNDLLFLCSEPHVGPVPLNKTGHPFKQLAIVNGRTTLLTIEHRYGHPPGPLARDAPVGPLDHHLSYPYAAPRGYPSHRVYGFKTPFPKPVVIHADEPLGSGPEDHRLFAPPAMGVRVGDRLLFDEIPQFIKKSRHLGICIPNHLALEVGHTVIKAALVVHRIVNL